MSKKEQSQEALSNENKKNIAAMEKLNLQAEKNKKEFEIMAGSWRQSLSDYKREHTELIESYRNQLDKLAAENMVLYDLPDSIDKRLAKTAPIFGKNLLEHLENKMDGLIASIKTSTNNAKVLEEKIDAAAEKIEGNRLKRFLVRVLFVSVIASVIAGGVSYVMLKLHPSTIRLDNAQNIHLQNGEVTLFRADKVHANQMRQRR